MALGNSTSDCGLNVLRQASLVQLGEIPVGGSPSSSRYIHLLCMSVCFIVFFNGNGACVQVVWATSYKVGCAVHLCPDGIKQTTFSQGVNFVCNYAPA